VHRERRVTFRTVLAALEERDPYAGLGKVTGQQQPGRPAPTTTTSVSIAEPSFRQQALATCRAR